MTRCLFPYETRVRCGLKVCPSFSNGPPEEAQSVGQSGGERGATGAHRAIHLQRETPLQMSDVGWEEINSLYN